MNLLDNKKIISRSPILTVFLIETGNISQIWRMFTERSASGQSLTGWIMVTIALLVWVNFYRVCNKEDKTAMWCTVLGVIVNLFIIGSILYFRR